mgnify:CR=1 FL=1
MKSKDIKHNLKGNIVPVPAQFNSDLSLNHSAYREHIKFLIDQGVKNFYLAQSASEFDYMTREERVAVTKTIAICMNSDCILIVQALGNTWIDEQIEEGKMMLDCGADAIVICPRGIKEGNKFFSSFYSQGAYSPERHDDYFVAYMERVSKELKAPIVYHDKPFKNGMGPSIDMLSRIADIENIVGLKEHVPDPLRLHTIYRKFGENLACFDGFGKTLQFWSMQWGAQGRHTCWSWFDVESDIRFVDSLQRGDLSEAADIINAEWPVARAICNTGFRGYKYIMQLMGLPAGPVRIPGETLSAEQKIMIENAVKEIGLLT